MNATAPRNSSRWISALGWLRAEGLDLRLGGIDRRATVADVVEIIPP